jgi:hypothetical protein
MVTYLITNTTESHEQLLQTLKTTQSLSDILWITFPGMPIGLLGVGVIEFIYKKGD